MSILASVIWIFICVHTLIEISDADIEIKSTSKQLEITGVSLNDGTQTTITRKAQTEADMEKNKGNRWPHDEAIYFYKQNKKTDRCKYLYCGVSDSGKMIFKVPVPVSKPRARQLGLKTQIEIGELALKTQIESGQVGVRDIVMIQPKTKTSIIVKLDSVGNFEIEGGLCGYISKKKGNRDSAIYFRDSKDDKTWKKYYYARRTFPMGYFVFKNSFKSKKDKLVKKRERLIEEINAGRVGVRIILPIKKTGKKSQAMYVEYEDEYDNEYEDEDINEKIAYLKGYRAGYRETLLRLKRLYRKRNKYN